MVARAAPASGPSPLSLFNTPLSLFNTLHLLCSQGGAELLAGTSKDVGPWALHLRPAQPAGGSAAQAPLHHLAVRLQDGQQLVQLKQFVLQALLENARRMGCGAERACACACAEAGLHAHMLQASVLLFV